ncbi:unnamed protein product, partial [Rotaria sp. Silwood2]
LTNIKLFDSTIQNGTQIHLHHHHVYHHSTSTPSSEHFYNRLDKHQMGYHSISASPTITTIENLNKENIRIPLSFKNPLFNNQIIQKEEKNTEGFILCIESLKSSSPSSSEQSLVHLTSRQSLQQQPLFVLNNGYMTGSTQNLTSSNINT